MYRSLIRSIATACIAGVLAVACVAQPPSGDVSVDPNLPAMQGTPWLWTSSTIADANVIPDPTKYAITFATDGTFSAQVDCNRLAGQFTYSESGDIDITPGPTTLAACPEPSLADVFVAGLSGATQYEIAANRLVLTGPAGAMTFAPTPPAPS
jgi:heat shock protein HslJ